MYKLVASTDVEKGSVGHWDIEIANEQTTERCQDTVMALIGEYAGGVWYQGVDAVKPTDEEVAQRLADRASDEQV